MPDGDFLYPTLDQHLIKLRQVGGLAVDEILKLRNAADLLVPRELTEKDSVICQPEI